MSRGSCGYMSVEYIRYWFLCIPHSVIMCNRVVLSLLVVFCIFFTHANAFELSDVIPTRASFIRIDQPVTLSSSDAFVDNIPRFKSNKPHTGSHYEKASGTPDVLTVLERKDTLSVRNVPASNTARSVTEPMGVVDAEIDPNVVPLDDDLFFTTTPVDT